MVGTTNSVFANDTVIRSGTTTGGAFLAPGTYDISPSWNNKILALWTSPGAYTFNLTKDVADALPCGFTVAMYQLSAANNITLNYGSSTDWVQIYRVKDAKMARTGSLVLGTTSSYLASYIKLTKLGNGNASWLMESNISF